MLYSYLNETIESIANRFGISPMSHSILNDSEVSMTFHSEETTVKALHHYRSKGLHTYWRKAPGTKHGEVVIDLTDNNIPE